MKRTIVILALVTAFVLAFTAVAQATWRGFTPTRPAIEAAPTIPGTIPATIPNPDVGEPGHDPGEAVGDPIPNPAPGDPGHVPAPAVPNPNFVGLHGFISFPEARLEMQRNLGVDGNFRAGGDYEDFGHRAAQAAALQGSAHGGYVTTTTKCVVCHSAHRATGVVNNADGSLNNVPGFDAEGRPLSGMPVGAVGNRNPATNPDNRDLRNQNQAFLTAGSTTCVACHVAGSAQASRLLVEWGGPIPGYAEGGGPHAGPHRGCVLCHNAGIHGLSTSRFNVMNVFMLGNTRSANRTGSGAMPGSGTGVPNNNDMNRDEQIAAEMHLWVGLDSRNQVAMQIPGGPGATVANTWWYDGARGLGPIGGLPPVAGMSATQYGAARSMATAYTCGESGCHAIGSFFQTNWGVGFDRRTGMGNNAGNQTANLGGGQTIGVRQMVTGHVMPSTRSEIRVDRSCGPCHGGSPAGFPTASTIEGQPDNSRRAYGCDQCHDMVGVATNSTAWPHGNRNILVYEWTADGDQIETFMGAGNLWMYAGSIARAADAPAITGNPSASSGAFRGQTSENPYFADQSWFVMTSVGSGRYGMPGPGAGTGLVDGSCLKCHVAIDPGSMYAANSVAADAIRHTWDMGGSPAVAAVPPVDGVLCSVCGAYEDDGTCPAHDGVVAVPGSPAIPAVPSTVAPSWNGLPVGGSQRLFLYR